MTGYVVCVKGRVGWTCQGSVTDPSPPLFGFSDAHHHRSGTYGAGGGRTWRRRRYGEVWGLGGAVGGKAEHPEGLKGGVDTGGRKDRRAAREGRVR